MYESQGLRGGAGLWITLWKKIQRASGSLH